MISFRQFIQEAEVSADKRKGLEHLHKMKPLDFLKMIEELDSIGGKISTKKIKITEKIDGTPVKFGLDDEGRFFIEDSGSGPQFEPGWFTKRRKAGGDDRADKMDDIREKLEAFQPLNDLLKQYPGGIKISTECLYNPFAKITDKGHQFVLTSYDPKKLGKWATFIFFWAKALDGTKIDQEEFRKKLESISNGEILFSNNKLKDVNLDVSTEINNFKEAIKTFGDVETIIKGRKDPEAKKALLKLVEDLQKQISDAITNGIKAGKFGEEYEGIVLKFASGKEVKVTSDRFKKDKSNRDAARAKK